MKNKLFILLVGIIFITFGCNTSQEENTQETESKNNEQKIVLAKAPDFNADSAYVLVEKQVNFGFRVPNTPAHKACGTFLVQTLQNYQWQVIEQNFDAKAFDGTILKSKNIIASLNPTATKRILLAAHWDTRPFADKDDSLPTQPIDGANDGASGVAILLEIARKIGEDPNKPKIGIDIILFDSEDYGPNEKLQIDNSAAMWCLGSQYWAKNKHLPNYSAFYGILLDMVGGKNAKFYQEGNSVSFANSIVKKVWEIGQKIGFGNYFINQQSPGILDDHYYINTIAKIPTIDIIEYSPSKGDSYFGAYHHTHQDNMKIIDKNTLKAVGQTVLQVIYQEKEAI